MHAKTLHICCHYGDTRGRTGGQEHLRNTVRVRADGETITVGSGYCVQVSTTETLGNPYHR